MPKTSVAVVLSVASVWLLSSWAIAAERPNILWITSEDHGPAMGCYGDALARTPNVDALAAKGMRFTRVWSIVPVCAPARTSIITGMYPSSTGGLHMRSMAPLPAGVQMFPQLLRAAGYYCTNNVKEDYNLRKPEGLWDASSQQAHWKHRGAGQPFFAVFNSTKSHESQLRTRPHKQITDPANVRVPAYHPDTPEVRQDWAQYYDKVAEADADAGARLAELADSGLADETIVFYFADHGSGMPRSKRWPGNSGLHVPLVVYFPPKWQHLAPREYQPGGKSDRMLSFVDLGPTVLSIAGVKIPEWMQGRAAAGTQQADPPKFLFGERGRMDESIDLMRSATDGRYVYLRNYYPHVSHGQHNTYQFQTPTTRVWREWFVQGKTNAAQSRFWQVPKESEELYDLHSDRDEVKNLAASSEHQAILEKLRQAQREHAAKIRDVCLLPEGEMQARALGMTPYDFAHDPAKYPFERVRDAAELAANLDPGATPALVALLSDKDSGVRYWAAMGLLMRGSDAVAHEASALRTALDDASPFVRVVAAQALAQYGNEMDHAKALEVLIELAPPEKHDVFVAMAALGAIDSLGAKASSLVEQVRQINPRGPSPDPRFDPYVPRLIAQITGTATDEEPSATSKAAKRARNRAAREAGKE